MLYRPLQSASDRRSLWTLCACFVPASSCREEGVEDASMNEFITCWDEFFAWMKLLYCVYSGLLLIMWPSSDHLPKVVWITRCSKDLTSGFHFESNLYLWYLITVTREHMKKSCNNKSIKTGFLDIYDSRWRVFEFCTVSWTNKQFEDVTLGNCDEHFLQFLCTKRSVDNEINHLLQL